MPEELPDSYGTDLLYVVARDPKSLFLYWDLDWTRLFAEAGLDPRQVHLRIYRADGAAEATVEINPFRGHCYVEVAAGGTAYYCELGCFEGDEWRNLARSGTTTTPEAVMSEDLSTDFAALPLHLNFQRMLDVFRASKGEKKDLATSVSVLQENARTLREAVTPEEWKQLVATAAASLQGGNGNGAGHAEISALLESAREAGPRPTPTAEQLAQWKTLSERLGGSSWGGASGNGFSGRSSA